MIYLAVAITGYFVFKKQNDKLPFIVFWGSVVSLCLIGVCILIYAYDLAEFFASLAFLGLVLLVLDFVVSTD